jgi:hypothetical protein
LLNRRRLARVNEAWNEFAKELKIVTLRRVTVQRDLVLQLAAHVPGSGDGKPAGRPWSPAMEIPRIRGRTNAMA